MSDSQAPLALDDRHSVLSDHALDQLFRGARTFYSWEDKQVSETTIRALYERNGWHETWTATVFDYQHYHPDAHEALTVARGWADLQIGGPSGEILRVDAGDAIVLPAGVGHCRMDQSADFQICGAYPADQPHGTVIRAPEERTEAHVAEIAALSRPESDPIFGTGGPLTIHWGRSGDASP